MAAETVLPSQKLTERRWKMIQSDSASTGSKQKGKTPTVRSKNDFRSDEFRAATLQSHEGNSLTLGSSKRPAVTLNHRWLV